MILGESMVPTLSPGDLFIIQPVPVEIVEGTVIVFHSPFGDLVAHRVVECLTMHNTIYYVTKGDANPTSDSFLIPNTDNFNKR